MTIHEQQKEVVRILLADKKAIKELQPKHQLEAILLGNISIFIKLIITRGHTLDFASMDFLTDNYVTECKKIGFKSEMDVLK